MPHFKFLAVFTVYNIFRNDKLQCTLFFTKKQWYINNLKISEKINNLNKYVEDMHAGNRQKTSACSKVDKNQNILIYSFLVYLWSSESLWQKLDSFTKIVKWNLKF